MKQMKDLYKEMYTSSDYFELKTLIADCLESPNGRFDNKVEVTAAFRKVCQVSHICTKGHIDVGDEFWGLYHLVTKCFDDSYSL